MALHEQTDDDADEVLLDSYCEGNFFIDGHGRFA